MPDFENKNIKERSGKSIRDILDFSDKEAALAFAKEKGVSKKVLRRISRGFDKVKANENRDYLIGENGFNVITPQGALTSSGKNTGNKKGFNAGDLIGLGNDISSLAGLAALKMKDEQAKADAQEEQIQEGVDISVKPLANPKGNKPEQDAQKNGGGPAAPPTQVRSSSGSGSRKPLSGADLVNPEDVADYSTEIPFGIAAPDKQNSASVQTGFLTPEQYAKNPDLSSNKTRDFGNIDKFFADNPMYVTGTPGIPMNKLARDITGAFGVNEGKGADFTNLFGETIGSFFDDSGIGGPAAGAVSLAEQAAAKSSPGFPKFISKIGDYLGTKGQKLYRSAADKIARNASLTPQEQKIVDYVVSGFKDFVKKNNIFKNTPKPKVKVVSSTKFSK